MYNLNDFIIPAFFGFLLGLLILGSILRYIFGAFQGLQRHDPYYRGESDSSTGWLLLFFLGAIVFLVYQGSGFSLGAAASADTEYQKAATSDPVIAQPEADDPQEGRTAEADDPYPVTPYEATGPLDRPPEALSAPGGKVFLQIGAFETYESAEHSRPKYESRYARDAYVGEKLDAPRAPYKILLAFASEAEARDYASRNQLKPLLFSAGDFAFIE